MKKRLIKMLFLGFKHLQDPYYQGFAAQIAFYITLSLVPTVLVLSRLLGLLDISLDFISEWIDRYVAPNMAVILKGLVSNSPAITTNIVMIIMAVWAASRAQFSIMRIANYTYTSGKTTGKFWRERLRAMKTTLLTLFTFAFVAIIFVYGKMILTLIFGKTMAGSFINALWVYLRWPVAGALYFLMVSYSYYVLPFEKLKFKEILPGSLFAAIGMLVVTIIYSAYVNYSVNYDIIYGSFASFVALLFWFYLLSWVLCLGILFNKVYKETKT